MRTNHPGSAALNCTASNLTPLRFSSAIDHLRGKRVCVAKTKFACRIETACFPTLEFAEYYPAIIQVGASNADLGATIPGPQADLNLGIKTFLNGALVSNIVLDTSAVATDTIDYVATDGQGLTSTSTRTVVVELPAPPG